MTMTLVVRVAADAATVRQYESAVRRVLGSSGGIYADHLRVPGVAVSSITSFGRRWVVGGAIA